MTLYEILWHYMTTGNWQKLTIAKYALCHLTFVYKQSLQHSKNAKENKESSTPHWNQFWCCCDIFSYSCQMFANEIYSSRYLLCREDRIPRIRKIQISLRKLQRVRNWLPIQCEQYCSSQGLLFVKKNYKNKRSTNTDCKCQYNNKYIIVKIQLVRIITNGCLYLVN